MGVHRDATDRRQKSQRASRKRYQEFGYQGNLAQARVHQKAHHSGRGLYQVTHLTQRFVFETLAPHGTTEEGSGGKRKENYPCLVAFPLCGGGFGDNLYLHLESL